jgi:hypothetical protein
MRKALLTALMLVISVAFVTAVFAQATVDKPAAAAPQKAHASAPGKKPVVERTAPGKKHPRGKTHSYTGDVTKVDTMLKTIVVKGKKDEMTFDVGMAQMKGDAREGDKVTVKYAKKDGKMIASSVTKAGEEKEMKKEMKPGAKPIKPASAKK